MIHFSAAGRGDDGLAWIFAALSLHQLGREREALELAREELELSRRWGAPRTVGISLRVLGLLEGGIGARQFPRELDGGPIPSLEWGPL